ncbi:MAG: shikimate kinase [Eubacteriales bacterium]|nr:shikimate kinase [Eubacteriales bacterium]
MRDCIILIGFMGAGKTSVGQALASLKQLPLLDTDQMIEQEAGMTISKIFAGQGEAAFRAAEAAVLRRLLDEEGSAVISTGGGLPLDEGNQATLRQLGDVVFLRVKPETVLMRLEGDTTRPLLQGDDAEKKVHSLLAFRNPIYQSAADVAVDVDGRTVGGLAEEITRRIAEVQR